MTPLLAALPLALTVACILARVPPLAACAAGAATCIGFILLGDFAHWPALPADSAATVGVLGLSAALVILPGLWLNALLRAAGVLDALAERIAALPLARADKGVILVLGVAPAIESLTGFGVSMFLTVPLLLRLFPAAAACRLAMLGMNIMPWGTLALSTMVGAALAGIEADRLGLATAQASMLIFPMLGVMAAALLGEAGARGRGMCFGAAVGVVLSVALWVANRWGILEIAGLLAALAATAAGLCMGRRTHAPHPAAAHSWGAALWPYVALIALVCVTRAPPLYGWLAHVPLLRAGELLYAPLTSPGVPLTLTAVMVWVVSRRCGAACGRRALVQSWRPLSALLAFLAFAQLFRDGGFVAVLAHAMTPLADAAGWVVAPTLGVMSGYVTASGVGGNALLMAMQYELGAAAGGAAQGLWVAALQNSAAGHSVFASLPILVLIRTLAAVGDDPATSTAALARFGLVVLAAVWLVLCVTAWLG